MHHLPVLVATLLGAWGIVAAAPMARAGPSAFSAEQWREDLRFTMQKLAETHPKLDWHVRKDSLLAAALVLERRIPELADDEILVGLMRLVSMVRDGHTWIVPWESKFSGGAAFPLRFYRFSDGLFITEAPSTQAELAGAKVLRIGGVPADEAFDRVSGLLGYDNVFTRLHRGPAALATPAIMRGAGLSRTRDSLEVTVLTRRGLRRTVRVAAVADSTGGEWLWKGEGLPVAETVSSTDGVSRFPLSRRRPKNYWFEYLPESKTLYCQFNAVLHDREEPFDQFCARMWRFADGHGVDKFILDLRQNGGGNNRILKPLLHGFIKRDSINRRGHFLAITGRATFSAAMNCQGFLEEQTEVLFVGEPSGASPNHAGDPMRYVLPQSGARLMVSKYVWHNAPPWDKREFVRPQIPATLSSKDFFAGRDPALEAALTLKDYESLPDVLRQAVAGGGISAGRKAFRDYKKRFPDEFGASSESEINYLGYDLLGGGALDRAIEIFRLNAEIYPGSWNVWDSLGEALMAKGDKAGAIGYYEKSVKLNPQNVGGRAILRRLRGE
jgi:hypothetical protein